ncbi:MAG: LytR family transcriptional regulator [Lachnospiraceae bacterium]|nr:LytR family transcriptional regulator [Lachnospiraceae bacterium]
MKKQSPVGLFFTMFLRASVIILGIAIIIFGIVFLTKVMKSDNKKAEIPPTTIDENVLTEAGVRDDLIDNTEEPTSETTEELIMSYDKKILVLNSTDKKGLAGRWCERLNGYGYANTDAKDYMEPLTATRIVATSEGVGEDLVQYFNGATYEVGTVTENVYESTEGYDIVIIIGINDDDGQSVE